MTDPNKYTTISAPATGDFRDRGSKFLSFAWRVNTPQEIKEHLQQLKKEHPKAAHHCYAWRIGIDGMQYRANDDGEPAGSAGRPILGQIDSSGLTNVLVVVVRYFGGTLLGVPGLINAYKTVTAGALDAAPKVEQWVEDVFEIHFDHPAMGEVLYLLKQAEATILSRDLQLFCVVKAGIPRVNKEACIGKLAEIRGVTIRQAT
jgi:uncharacterized YigZ family protein